MAKLNATHTKKILRAIHSKLNRLPKDMSLKDGWRQTLYVQLNQKTGAKVFVDREKAEYSFKLQKKLATEGLAPKAFAQFTFSLADGKFFIYITEHAQVEKIDFLTEDTIATTYYLAGYIFADLHWKNIGRVKRKLVCIDFEPGTLVEIK